MCANTAIFIFTRNRAGIFKGTLSKNINILSTLGIKTIILDTSTNISLLNSIVDLINNKRNIVYHGTREQNRIIQYLRENCNINIAPFIPIKLNNPKWNLGYVRNYAIIYGKLMNLKKILYMDDDILIPTDEHVINTFKKLSFSDVVGANISGQPDYSIIEKLMFRLGIKPNRPEGILSGGFMAFDIEKCSREFFMNIYNEDWIWQIMNCNIRSEKYGEVYQISEDILDRKDDKGILEIARWQSLGEIAVDGLLKAKEGRCINWNKLISYSFWDSIIESETNKLSDIIKLMEKTGKINSRYIKLLRKILQYHTRIEPHLLSSIFRRYSILKRQWLKLISKVSSCSIDPY